MRSSLKYSLSHRIKLQQNVYFVHIYIHTYLRAKTIRPSRVDRDHHLNRQLFHLERLKLIKAIRERARFERRRREKDVRTYICTNSHLGNQLKAAKATEYPTVTKTRGSFGDHCRPPGAHNPP